jgi:hypothetical protein
VGEYERVDVNGPILCSFFFVDGSVEGRWRVFDRIVCVTVFWGSGGDIDRECGTGRRGRAFISCVDEPGRAREGRRWRG